MKRILILPALAIGLLAHSPLSAQDTTPPQRPENATGLCRDGSYTTEAARNSACKGHHGVRQWFPATPAPEPPPAPAAASAPPAAANPPVSQAAPSKTTQAREQSLSAAKAAADAASDSLATRSIAGPSSQANASAPNTATRRRMARKKPAPGGGLGLVWLNPASNTYHCPGTAYYGRTRTGSYMSEDDAKARGAHIVSGESCPAQ
ncbi:MAG TPA: DUF3761 domain-containing protein [Granulicella sp.]